MTDSKHWVDDGAPAEFERLLSAARNEAPPATGVQRALVAAGVAGGASLASATAAGAAGSTFTRFVLGGATKWLAVGMLGAGAVAVTVQLERGGTNVSTQPPPAKSAHAANGTSGGNVAPKTTPLPAAVVPTVEPSPAVEQPSVVQTESPARVASARARTTSEPRVDDRAFAEELALLDTARSKWRAGNAAGAIQSASEYRRRFPAGRFVPEALFLLMQARLELGQEQAAREVASELVRRFPNTPQVTRAREVLKSDEATQKP